MINHFIQFIQSIMFLRSNPNYITVFGSAKKNFEQDHPFGELAFKVGKKLAQSNYTVMTGGGPGIMSKVNEGAFHVDPYLSIGCKLNVLSEPPNPFMSRFISTNCLAIRKKVLFQNAQAFIVLPGGYGTLDELFEVLTMIKVKLIEEKKPVFLIDSEFWKPLIDFINTKLKKNGTIVDNEVNLIQVVDSEDEIVDSLQKRAVCEGVYI